jgi:hypothetical protein
MRQLGEASRLIDVLLGLSILRAGRGQFTDAKELAQEAMAYARRSSDPRVLGAVHGFLGTGWALTGQLAPAREHIEKAVELFASLPIAHLGPIAVAQRGAEGVLGMVLAALGHPDAARARHGSAVAAARRRSDPFGLSLALVTSASTQLLLRNAEEVDTLAEELVPLTHEYGIGVNQRRAIFFRGWAMAVGGRTLEGIGEMRRALAELVDPQFKPFMNAAFAELCAKNKLVEEGLATVEESLAELQGGADAELHRVQGELLLSRVPPDQARAEHSFREAIQVARGQAARLYELRATINLARLLHDTDRHDEARTMLAEIYNWFTEGFDNADLKDAKALLDELSS